MSLKDRWQKQSVVYWAPASDDSGGQAFDTYGQPLYSDPVEKKCRWENVGEIFVNQEGTEEISRSVVMIDDIKTGGLLMLGTLSDITDSVNPRNNTGAWEIRKVEEIPNRSASLFYMWAYL